jgi:hypothetical protein
VRTKCTYCVLSLAIVFALASTSCIKEDIGNIENNLTVTPEYAVPIGYSSFSLADMVGNLGFDTIPVDSILSDTIIVDTSLSTDSTFVYEGRRFLLPPNSYVDTVLLEFYDFSNMQAWVENANALVFRLNIENAIPAGIDLQISLLNASGDTILKLFEPPGLNLDPATPPQSYLLSPYDTDTLGVEEIMLLPTVRSIYTYVGMHVQSESTGARYYSDQFFKMQMGVYLSLQQELGE